MTEGLRTWISPVWPGARISPVSRSGDPKLDTRWRQAGGVEVATPRALLRDCRRSPAARWRRMRAATGPVRSVTTLATFSVTGVAPHMM